MLRRSLLTFVLTSAAIALSGCAFFDKKDTITEQVVSDVALVATGLLPIAAVVAGIAGVPPATISAVTALVMAIETQAGKIVTGVTTTEAQVSVQTLDMSFESLLEALGGITVPDNVEQILKAVQALMPVIMAAIGMAMVAAPFGTMTADEARKILEEGIK